MYNHAFMKEQGRKQAQVSELRTAGHTLANQYTDLSDQQVVALLAAIMNDEWDDDVVSGALTRADIEFDLGSLTQDFAKRHILMFRKGKPTFHKDFMEIAADLMIDIIDNAPAKMFPSTELPEEWTHSTNSLNMRLVKNNGIFQNEYTIENMPRVYAAVNRLQSVSFKVNPIIGDYLERVVGDTQGMQRAQLLAQMQLVNHMREYNNLYFYCTMDFRGRIYYRGGIITPQGSDFEKACFHFTESKPLGKDGIKALAIHYANMCGHDKLPLTKRLAWAKKEGLQHAHKVLSGEITHGKKEKFQAIVAAHEWLRLSQHEGPVETFESHLVIHQDGTCNGLQHGAALTGDRKTATAVNCVASSPSDAPADVYGLAAGTILDELDKTSLVNLAASVDHHGRKLMKLPVMVTGYGAGAATAVRDFVKDLTLNKAKKELEDNEEAFTECMKHALGEHCGAMITLTKAFQEQLTDKWHKAVTWETEDGFMVYQYRDAKGTDHEGNTEREYAGAGEFVVRVDSGVVNESSQICGISPNFVHSIDATHLRNVINACSHDLVTVHDSIGSHACDFFKTNRVLRETFVSTHEYDWVESFNHYNDADLTINKGDYDASEVLESRYFFS